MESPSSLCRVVCCTKKNIRKENFYFYFLKKKKTSVCLSRLVNTHTIGYKFGIEMRRGRNVKIFKDVTWIAWCKNKNLSTEAIKWRPHSQNRKKNKKQILTIIISVSLVQMKNKKTHTWRFTNFNIHKMFFWKKFSKRPKWIRSNERLRD